MLNLKSLVPASHNYSVYIWHIHCRTFFGVLCKVSSTTTNLTSSPGAVMTGLQCLNIDNTKFFDLCGTIYVNSTNVLLSEATIPSYAFGLLAAAQQVHAQPMTMVI